MGLHRSKIQDDITTLGDFETRYGEFLLERRNRERDWSGEEWARRERELKELAPQAEAAMTEAGSTRWDEGPVRANLPARILAFVDEGDGIDDTEQWRILDELPTHIGALKGKLKRVPGVPDMGLKHWETELEARDAEARSSRVPIAATPQPVSGSWWREPNPWVLAIVVGLFTTIAGGVIAALILSA